MMTTRCERVASVASSVGPCAHDRGRRQQEGFELGASHRCDRPLSELTETLCVERRWGRRRSEGCHQDVSRGVEVLPGKPLLESLDDALLQLRIPEAAE